MILFYLVFIIKLSFPCVINYIIRLSNWCNEFEEAATRAIAAERAADAIKVKAAAMAKAMGAVKAKAADEWTCADRIHKSQWISVMMQWYEMTDILAELAECKMQKLE